MIAIISASKIGTHAGNIAATSFLVLASGVITLLKPIRTVQVTHETKPIQW